MPARAEAAASVPVCLMNSRREVSEEVFSFMEESSTCLPRCVNTREKRKCAKGCSLLANFRAYETLQLVDHPLFDGSLRSAGARLPECLLFRL